MHRWEGNLLLGLTETSRHCFIASLQIVVDTIDPTPVSLFVGLIGREPTRLGRPRTRCPKLVDAIVCWCKEVCRQTCPVLGSIFAPVDQIDLVRKPSGVSRALLRVLSTFRIRRCNTDNHNKQFRVRSEIQTANSPALTG